MRIASGLRRLLILCSIVLTVLAAAGWVRSYFVADWVQRATGEVHEPTSPTPLPSDPFASEWSYCHRTFVARHAQGTLFLVKGQYTSYRSTREELGSWEQQRGWRYEAADPSARGVASKYYFNSILDWLGPGIGITPFNKQGESGYAVVLPYWLALLVVASPATMCGLLAWRTERRRKAGRCTACGYDLQGQTATCPECGVTAELTTVDAQRA